MNLKKISEELKEFMRVHGNSVRFIPVRIMLNDAIGYPMLAGHSFAERARVALALQRANKEKFAAVLQEINTLAKSGDRDGEMNHFWNTVYCQLSLAGIERLSNHPDID